MAEIRALKTPQERRNEAAVEICKELVERTESGELETIFAICFMPDGNYDMICSEQIDSLRKIGALHRLIHDILANT